MSGTWAIFDEDGSVRIDGYRSEKDADEDLYGRPEGCFVARPCRCIVPAPFEHCAPCRDTGTEGYDDGE